MAAYTTIDDPSAFFKVQLYTGNGSANHAITFDDTDTDMQPDFVWIKNRDATDSHCLFDAVRGATKVIHSDAVTAESTDTDTLDSFASDGFQVDADVKVNTNTEKYVAWCWKAGTTSGISGGTITPSAYSINTTSGIGIYEYGGTGSAGTIAHGLGAVPGFMAIKVHNYTYDWQTYHDATGNLGHNVLNDGSAFADDDSRWNDTSPTSTVWSMGTGSPVNNSNYDFIAYVFADVQGFSKFGSYEGNGNADGTFVYTGFKPACVIAKDFDRTDGRNWHIYDNKRPGYNPSDLLLPSVNNAENTSQDNIDLLSNGFKFRVADNSINGAATYFYAAWAESPFVNSNGVPNNAS